VSQLRENTWMLQEDRDSPAIAVPAKRLLTAVGARTPLRWIYHLQAAVNYLRIGRWMRDRGYDLVPKVRNRWQVFDAISSRLKNERVLYLEFGVYQGASIRYWASQLTHPDARLHGFDSFEGLPESWGPYTKGHFSTDGKIPAVDDSRVTFFKGWFDEVLPSYKPPAHDVLLIVMDADLYSSTLYVLNQMRQYIRPGTFIYFDEMNHVDHEPKAFAEFMTQSSLRFRPVCADLTLAFACFECVGHN
jgi:Methyltransferase domain